MSTEEQIERLKTTGRNDPCPCGSGKKYKKCHLFEDEAAQHDSMKKAADEREAALAAEAAEAEEAGDDSDKKSKKVHKKAPGDAGHAKGGGQKSNANRPSNIPRRGAV